MKISIYIMFLVSFMACQKPTENKEVYSFLFDATDTHIQKPTTKEVLNFVEYTNRDKLLHIRMSHLSSVDYNTINEWILGSEDTGIFANALHEKRATRKFHKEIKDYLSHQDSVVVKYQESSIFDPIVHELAYLSKLKGYDAKVLVVNSDLMENNSWTSFYTTQDLKLLYYRKAQLKKRYLKHLDTALDFSKLRVYIRYTPKNAQDNIRYKHLRELYTQVFKEIGVSVTFCANLHKAQTLDE